jgi:CO/xanthine dehydrogenase FAD-binding subunit
MKPPAFEYVAASSAADAVEALRRYGDEAKILAGGQSLMPMLALRLARPSALVDINRCDDLEGLAESGGVLTVGALARQRDIPADKLYLAPLTTSLESDELATSARFQLPPEGAGWGFAEVARRHGDFALVGCAAVLALDGAGAVSHARLGFFGVGGTPVRSAPGEAALMGREPTPARVVEAAKAAAAVLSPDGDLHASADYRKKVAATLAERVLAAALSRCGRAR